MTRRNLVPYFILGPAVVIAAIGWYRSDQGRRDAVERLSKLEAAASAPKVQLQASQTPTTQEPVPAIGKDQAATPRPSSQRVPSITGDPAQDTRTIEELHGRIQALSNDLTIAREEAVRHESKAAAEAAESKKLQAQIEELQTGLQAAKQNAEAAIAEVRVKSERLTRAEASEKAAVDRAARAEAAVAKGSTQSKELEDLNRRRETVVTSLQRHYRDVTDIYRNFSLNAQTRDTSNAGMQAGDLSRIQAAIQQAEDDLRQLQTLNARITQLSRSK